ncbi:hypothetical protein FQZ97_522910 [compost metagenome]
MAYGAVQFVVDGGIAAVAARAAGAAGLRALRGLALLAGLAWLAGLAGSRRAGLSRRLARARRLRRGHRRDRGRGRLVRQRARHAARRRRALLGRLAGLLAADGRAGGILVGLVALVGVLDDGEVHVCRHLRTHVVLADDRRQDCLDALQVVLLQRLHVLELGGVEHALVAGIRQQVAVLVDDRDRLGRQLRHARRHQVADRRDLALVDGAPRVQLQHDRGGGLLALAHEQRRLGDRQVHAGRLHRRDRFDRARQLAFQPALVIDLLGKLADAEFLVVHQLHARGAALGQALRSEPQPRLMDFLGGHHHRAAAFGELVRHIHLLQRLQHRTAVALRQVAVQHLVVRRARPQHAHRDGGCQRRAAEHQGQPGIGLQALQHLGRPARHGNRRGHARAPAPAPRCSRRLGR